MMSAEQKNDSSDEQGDRGGNRGGDRAGIDLPGDERDVLIARVIDGVATSTDWATFRSVADHDPSIWAQLARAQHLDQAVCSQVERLIWVADQVELPDALVGGGVDDGPMRARLDLVSRWGGWAAAAAIVLVWFFGQSGSTAVLNEHDPVTAGILGSGVLLDQAKPDQAFDQYLSSGQTLGQVVGEMPERIVIETRPMPDGTIEVLYLRQIIERQVIDHAYREMRDETGNVFPVPVKLSPTIERAF